MSLRKRFMSFQKSGRKNRALTPSTPSPEEPDKTAVTALTPNITPDLVEDRKSLGLFVLVEPPSWTVDVVAIHGLNGDYLKSWTHRVSGAMWLKEFLPSSFPNARVMSFGWDSRITGNSSTATLKEWADQLAVQLSLRRQSAESRGIPIIIIAHNVGGLMAKRMLLNASLTPRRIDIFNSVAAIVFLGTPHRGFGSLSTFFAISTIGSRNNTLLSELKESQSHRDLDEQFYMLLDGTHLDVYSFYEMQKTGLVPQLVSKDEAFLGHPRERLSGLASNHSGLAKFDSREDWGYIQIVAAIDEAIDHYARRSASPLRAPSQEPSSDPARLESSGLLGVGPDFPPTLRYAHQVQSNPRPQRGELPSPIRREPAARFVFDTLATSEGVETGSVFAEEWFDNLRDKVHQTVEERHKDSDPRVKVAILDSGVDRSHPMLKDFFDRGQITAKSFIEGEPGTRDVCGHGTHMVDLILRTAPNAHVCMVKVFLSGQSTEMDRNQNLIAEAIRHAMDIEQADIISMSWGYQKEIPIITKAIREAFHRNTIIIASASNMGSLSKESVAFPASLRQVICINSTDGYGNPSEFNPAPSPDRGFAVIGEGLQVACPLKIGDILRVIRGTSAAAAIASGLATLVLQYSRQRANAGKAVKEPSRLKDCDAMRKVFYGMSNQRLGYHVLVPDLIFHETGEERHYRISQRISAMLDAL
ncbi:peptidase S8/S53 domain-containing protein [Chaetomium fimeti]|uniref:Peptidase S8/S53 domain-containing protein n=1 Tax=Chaetomium fimeti TaxID=1854472 RepID=A0AAE0LV71_9PEZI|nr:peptidase S8/S53 domain-containing protein [Chaetomium fimeti]